MCVCIMLACKTKNTHLFPGLHVYRACVDEFDVDTVLSNMHTWSNTDINTDIHTHRRRSVVVIVFTYDLKHPHHHHNHPLAFLAWPFLAWEGGKSMGGCYCSHPCYCHYCHYCHYCPAYCHCPGRCVFPVLEQRLGELACIPRLPDAHASNRCCRKEVR